MTPFKIQLVFPEDDPRAHQQINRLDSTCFPEDDPEDKTEGYWWLAYDRETGEAVGFAGLMVGEDGAHATLSRVGVLAHCRCQGLHKRLIKVREGYCRRLGVSRVVSYVAPHNLASANNLIKAGYTLIEPADWDEEGWYLHFERDIGAPVRRPKAPKASKPKPTAAQPHQFGVLRAPEGVCVKDSGLLEAGEGDGEDW